MQEDRKLGSWDSFQWALADVGGSHCQKMHFHSTPHPGDPLPAPPPCQRWWPEHVKGSSCKLWFFSFKVIFQPNQQLDSTLLILVASSTAINQLASAVKQNPQTNEITLSALLWHENSLSPLHGPRIFEERHSEGSGNFYHGHMLLV